MRTPSSQHPAPAPGTVDKSTSGTQEIYVFKNFIQLYCANMFTQVALNIFYGPTYGPGLALTFFQEKYPAET